jgi:hypothetical protein
MLVFGAAEYVPAAQFMQTWFVLAVPAVAMYCPAGQAVQATHAVALLAALNWPAGQAVHTRSVVPVPAALT